MLAGRVMGGCGRAIAQTNVALNSNIYGFDSPPLGEGLGVGVRPVGQAEHPHPASPLRGRGKMGQPHRISSTPLACTGISALSYSTPQLACRPLLFDMFDTHALRPGGNFA